MPASELHLLREIIFGCVGEACDPGRYREASWNTRDADEKAAAQMKAELLETVKVDTSDADTVRLTTPSGRYVIRIEREETA